jgi:PPK2 family polyphosphate:nucleotide phosphotransferase
MKLNKLAKRFRVDKPAHFRLSDHDPADTGGLALDKHSSEPLLAKSVARLAGFQQLLYADDRWALLVILQGMDAAGKDSTIKHVMSGVNPQGCDVHSFKQPTSEELDHDFLWREGMRLPMRGRIGIFNRSYYEEVLVARTHADVLEHERLPHIGKHVWKERYEDICAFERHLVRNGTVVLKFHLHLSKEEQRQRLLARLDEPAKRYKFSMNDVAERALWDQYMAAYEHMIRHTTTAEAPWFVIPADDKWFARIAVASIMAETLEALDLAFPEVKGKALTELKKVRQALEAEAPKRKH